MSRPLTWRHLVPGLIVCGVAVALVVSVLLFARIGGVRGETTRLYTVTNTASRVIDGTEVWLGGQKIGVVDEVRFRPVSADTTERLVIAMRVLTKYLSHIRRDADVQLRPGSGLIGAPVVYITMGTPRAPAAQAGDTLRARAQVEHRSRTADFSSLGDSIVAAGTTLEALSQQIRETGVEIDHLRRHSERQAIAVGAALSRFATRATASHGSFSQLHNDRPLHAAVGRIIAQADSIQQVLTSSRTSLGRFRKDSTIFVDAHHVLETMDTLRLRFSSTTAARAFSERPDSALTHQLERSHAQLDSLVTDAKRHPLRYLPL